ncbi:MAG TPA: hypothetical protein ENG40_02115 [Thermoprotei archaeon]|nr:hypothetical protein [Thermoprotei archaeon]
MIVVLLMIDVHTHIGQVLSWSPYLIGKVYSDLNDLLKYMDSVGINIVVLLAVPGYIETDGEIFLSDKVLKAASKYPDRILPFCVVDPRTPSSLRKMKKYFRMGCKGIGEYKVKLYIDDKRALKLYEMAAEKEVPILIHMDDKFNPDIYRFEKILDDFRDTIFVMHGPGWWKHISGETESEVYSKGDIKPGGKVLEILSRYKNVYADISAFSGLNALSRNRDFSKKFLEKFQDQILYGTDFPCLANDGSQFGPNRKHLNLLKSLDLSKNVFEKIVSKNAEKILKLR